MQSSTPPLEVTYLRTTSLKPDPRNPRVHTDKQVRQIAQSIESFGFNVPLLIDDQQKVIAGHGRLLAACKMGWDTVPAIKLSHLTESQRMAFLIADNRLTENSSWDERMLGEQLQILSSRPSPRGLLRAWSAVRFGLGLRFSARYSFALSFSVRSCTLAPFDRHRARIRERGNWYRHRELQMRRRPF
jgi:hypothetical protein